MSIGITLEIQDNAASVSLSESGNVSLSVASDYVGEPVPVYGGPYTVTPGNTARTLNTDGFRMLDNVTVGAIPSNYGEILWNGSVITVR